MNPSDLRVPMNARDLAEKLIREFGADPPEPIIGIFSRLASLDPKRVAQLVKLAQIKVTWNE